MRMAGVLERIEILVRRHEVLGAQGVHGGVLGVGRGGTLGERGKEGAGRGGRCRARMRGRKVVVLKGKGSKHGKLRGGGHAQVSNECKSMRENEAAVDERSKGGPAAE